MTTTELSSLPLAELQRAFLEARGAKLVTNPHLRDRDEREVTGYDVRGAGIPVSVGWSITEAEAWASVPVTPAMIFEALDEVTKADYGFTVHRNQTVDVWFKFVNLMATITGKPSEAFQRAVMIARVALKTEAH